MYLLHTTNYYLVGSNFTITYFFVLSFFLTLLFSVNTYFVHATRQFQFLANFQLTPAHYWCDIVGALKITF